MKIKNLLSYILTVSFIVGMVQMIIPAQVSAATTARTSEAAGKWAADIVGKDAKDMDGAYGIQCLDLPIWYVSEFWGDKFVSLGGGNAKEMINSTFESGKWKAISTSSGENVLPGDIAVFGKTWGDSSFGHVGVVISATKDSVRIAEQYNSYEWSNNPDNPYHLRDYTKVGAFTYSLTDGNHSLLGVLRPPFEVEKKSEQITNTTQKQDSWVKAELPKYAKITIKSVANNKYVCAEINSGCQVNVNRDSASSWETFTVYKTSDGKYAFKAANDKFLSTRTDNKNLVYSTASEIKQWECFEVYTDNNGKYALKSMANSKYVQANLDDKNSPLRATADKINSWETFKITILDSEKKWSDWSAWTTKSITASDTVQVETAIEYRYHCFYCPNCKYHSGYWNTGCVKCGYTVLESSWTEYWTTQSPSQLSGSKFDYAKGTVTINGSLWFYELYSQPTRTVYHSRTLLSK